MLKKRESGPFEDHWSIVRHNGLNRGQVMIAFPSNGCTSKVLTDLGLSSSENTMQHLEVFLRSAAKHTIVHLECWSKANRRNFRTNHKHCTQLKVADDQ